jgi:hypothetical protein
MERSDIQIRAEAVDIRNTRTNGGVENLTHIEKEQSA